MAAEATNEYIETLTPQEIKDDKPAVLELNFSALKFEAQQGSKLGSFEVVHKTGNIAEKWASAFNILNSSNATIQNRYYGKGYDFSYWLLGLIKFTVKNSSKERICVDSPRATAKDSDYLRYTSS